MSLFFAGDFAVIQFTIEPRSYPPFENFTGDFSRNPAKRPGRAFARGDRAPRAADRRVGGQLGDFVQFTAVVGRADFLRRVFADDGCRFLAEGENEVFIEGVALDRRRDAGAYRRPHQADAFADWAIR